MVNITAENGELNGVEVANKGRLKGESREENMSELCSCGRFKDSSSRFMPPQGNHMKIDEALTKLRQELSQMQEQDKGILKQLMNVSSHVKRLRNEIRHEEEAKRRLDNDDSDSDSDSDMSLDHSADTSRSMEEPTVDENPFDVVQTTVVQSYATKDAIDHQRCDSGIMADDSDNETLSSSLNVSQKRKVFEQAPSVGKPSLSFEHNGSIPSVNKPPLGQQGAVDPRSKYSVALLDASSAKRTHVRSKSAESNLDVGQDFVRLGKFQVRLPPEHVETTTEKPIVGPTNDDGKQDESVRYALRKRAAGGAGVRDGLLVDISENGELKLHNNINAVQKNAKARHSEVRNAVFATLNSVQTRKMSRDDNASSPREGRSPRNSQESVVQVVARDIIDAGSNDRLSRSHNGIVLLREKKTDIPRSRSMDGILDANAGNDFVDYDDTPDDDSARFRRYSSCNYGNRLAVQVEPRASGRIGYNRTGGTANSSMEDDAKAYFEALKSKKVMIRSISSASIV